MKKSELKNSIVKRKYLTWLKDSGDYVQSTINSVEKSIWKYEEFTKGADFATFNKGQVKKFKSWLAQQKNNRGKGVISLTTQYHYLRHLKNFFTWLSGQPGYKSRVSVFDANLLKLEKEQAQIATSTKRVKYPSVEYVKELCASIKVENEIDMRD